MNIREWEALICDVTSDSGSDSSKIGPSILSEVPRMLQLRSPAKAQFRSFKCRLSSKDFKLESTTSESI